MPAWRAVFVWMALAVAFCAAVPAAAPAAPACTCRYGGQSYAQGRCVCIAMRGVSRMACCGKVLNNSSWSFTGEACPIAEAPDPDPPPTQIGARPPPPGASSLGKGARPAHY